MTDKRIAEAIQDLFDRRQSHWDSNMMTALIVKKIKELGYTRLPVSDEKLLREVVKLETLFEHAILELNRGLIMSEDMDLYRNHVIHSIMSLCRSSQAEAVRSDEPTERNE